MIDIICSFVTVNTLNSAVSKISRLNKNEMLAQINFGVQAISGTMTLDNEEKFINSRRLFSLVYQIYIMASIKKASHRRFSWNATMYILMK